MVPNWGGSVPRGSWAMSGDNCGSHCRCSWHRVGGPGVLLRPPVSWTAPRREGPGPSIHVPRGRPNRRQHRKTQAQLGAYTGGQLPAPVPGLICHCKASLWCRPLIIHPMHRCYPTSLLPEKLTAVAPVELVDDTGLGPWLRHLPTCAHKHHIPGAAGAWLTS